MASVRRSTRQSRPPRTNLTAQEPVEQIEVVAHRDQVAVGNKKPTGKADRKAMKGKATAENKLRKSKTAKAGVQTSTEQGGSLSSFPPEILGMVLHDIDDIRTINALSRTCKAFYDMMMPRLYKRIAVASMFHAHIPKLIRTLEPNLSISQRKQLKKEGKYKGQKERYPTGLGDQTKPLCASYVRELVVGVADPGKKHKYIVERYVEEALKNLDNLEVVETRLLTK
jgi:hypothetical protein